MIDAVNEILRDLIQSRVPALAGPSQVGFEAPNEDWRQNLITAGEERVNLYLFELRENLKLRTNERTRTPENGWYRESKPPARIDCRYQVTAWSPASFNPPSVEPSRDEHVLLYNVLDSLMRHRPLTPIAVYAPGVVIPSGRTLFSVPAPLRSGSLPMEAALPDAQREQSDFWSTMKVAWKPTVELTVTVPILLDQEDIESPMVTTLSVDYMPETLVSIGGQVLAGDMPVGGAWVQVLGMSPPELASVNQRTIARRDGRFQFARLWPGQYQLRVVATQFGEIQRQVDVPSATGEYDMRF